MTIGEFIADLRNRGIKLWSHGGKLFHSAPQGVLTPEIKSQAAERRAEILAFLEQRSAAVAPGRLPIPSVQREIEIPLSFAEEGLWLLEQLRPQMTAWNMQSTLRMVGALDIPALERSLNALVGRQEILRTAFKFAARGPSRIVLPELRLQLPVIDLSKAAEWKDEAGRIAGEDAKTPFDLSTAPLFRVKLLRSSETEHIVLLTQHHIITDAWSSGLFWKELFAFYEAFTKGVTPALADLPVQYSDYAFWLRRFKTSDIESHFFYWKSQLDGLRVAELPCDRQRRPERSFRGSAQRIRLSTSVSRAIRKLCSEERATPFMILLTALNVLIYRCTGESDIVVGSTITGRNKPELENLLGMFINVLPLRTDLSGRPAFRETLRGVRKVSLEAYEHQDYPVEKMVQELRPGSDLSRNSLFQVLLNVANVPSIPDNVNGLTLERMERRDDTARFDLTIYVPETRDGFEIIAAYNKDLFSSDRMMELLEQYKYLLEQAADDPDRKIDDYSLVTASAKRFLPDPTARLDDAWHGAAHELFARHASANPHKVAVQDPREAWSYQELNDRSNQLAHYLRQQGIRPGGVAAIYAHRSAALVWALLGVMKSGAAFCVIDPGHPAGRVKECLNALDAKALILIGNAGEPNGEMEKALKSVSQRCRITLPGLAVARASQFLSQYSTEDPAVTVTADDLVYVIFTSGSTGKPKGVMGRHGPLTHFLPWMAETFELSDQDSLSFLAGLATNKLQREVLTALTLGGTLCMPDPDDIGAFGRLDEWLRKESIRVVHLTPAMVELLDQTATQPIPSVRRVFFGGDLLRLRDVDCVRRLMPQAKIANLYNSSETQRGGGYIIFSDPAPQDAKEIPPLGRGVKDVQLLVLNSSLRLAGISEVGEIFVRSPHLAKGYLNDEQLTRERFIASPFTGRPGDRLYKTAELGRYLPDGTIQWAGRIDRQINIRGFRIEPGEVEVALNEHPAVQETVVMAREDIPGETRLVAYIVASQEAAPTTHELRRFLQQNLPDYMIPSVFVFLEALPLTANGKIDPRALPAPERTQPSFQGTFVSPRTPLESLIAEVWKDVLGVDRVGVYDNFFDLGGHSLLSVQAVARLEKETGVRIHAKAMVTNALGQLASAYEERMCPQLQTAGVTRRFWNAVKSALLPKRDDAQ